MLQATPLTLIEKPEQVAQASHLVPQFSSDQPEKLLYVATVVPGQSPFNATYPLNADVIAISSLATRR
jgi:hypothetical protein